MARRFPRLLAVLAVLLAAGCIMQESRDVVTVYRRPLWPGLIAFSLASYLLYTLARERTDRKQFFSVAGGTVVAVAIGGSFLTERAVVRPDGFEIWRGIWPIHERVDVRFVEIRELHYRRGTGGGKSKREPRLEWFTTSGDSASIATHGVSREACPEIRKRATEAGVKVEGFP